MATCCRAGSAPISLWVCANTRAEPPKRRPVSSVRAGRKAKCKLRMVRRLLVVDIDQLGIRFPDAPIASPVLTISARTGQKASCDAGRSFIKKAYPILSRAGRSGRDGAKGLL